MRQNGKWRTFFSSVLVEVEWLRLLLLIESQQLQILQRNWPDVPVSLLCTSQRRWPQMPQPPKSTAQQPPPPPAWSAGPNAMGVPEVPGAPREVGPHVAPSVMRLGPRAARHLPTMAAWDPTPRRTPHGTGSLWMPLHTYPDWQALAVEIAILRRDAPRIPPWRLCSQGGGI